jgi:hypothetical protein
VVGRGVTAAAEAVELVVAAELMPAVVAAE